MAAAPPSRIFGIKLGLDPRLLVGGLIVLASALFWFNSRSGEDDPAVRTPAASAPSSANAPGQTGNRPLSRRPSTAARRSTTASERSVLRVRSIDPSRGDIDPTLRLDLLARLRKVDEGKLGRSVFESGAAAAMVSESAALQAIKAPHIAVKPQPILAPPPPMIPPAVNIPLRYYGFAKPQEAALQNRGLFLDGDNVLVATEGQVVKGHYLVVELNARSARMEDTQMHQGQTLPVMPVASTP